MPFQPQVNQELILDSVAYRIVEHPAAPGMPYGQEGRQAIVYQLRSEAGERRAIKVFKPRFRSPTLVRLADKLVPFAALPGLQVCRRSVLTPQRHVVLLRQYPDLTYAVVMPWVAGPTWMEVLLEKHSLTPEQSLSLARSLASILTGCEERGLAHCDLSGPNVLLPLFAPSPSQGEVQEGNEGVALVDIEQIYSPGLERPQAMTSATMGYNHKTAEQPDFWGPYADRFAGAVLIAEMLGACADSVRAAAWGESYFDPAELQQDTERSRVLITMLSQCWGTAIADLFERAWRSESLLDCATFGEWLVMLPEQIPGAVKTLPKPDRQDNVTQTTGSSYLAPDVKAGTPGFVTRLPNLDQLRSQAYALISQGKWPEAVNTCNAILGQWPDQGDIALLLSRAQQLVKAHNELEQTWRQALQTGRAANWEACWKAAQAILQQAPKTARYQEILEQAEQEMTWAAMVDRADGLVSQGRLDEAVTLLDKVPANHPAAANVRAEIELARSKTRRIAELFQGAQEQLAQGAWDEAALACQTGMALGGAAADFQPLLEQAQHELEVERQVTQYAQEVAQAAQAQNWSQTLALLDKALVLRPQRPDLQAQHELFSSYQAWARQIEEAGHLLAAYDWDQALAALTDIPDDFMQAAAVREAAQREMQRQEQIATARQGYDGERVLALLVDAPSDYPRLQEWRDWANAEEQRRAQLELARTRYDGQRVLQLLSDVSADYPGLGELRRWAEAEVQRHQRLLAARHSYDGALLLQLLADAPADYPATAELHRWAQIEIERQTRLAQARQSYDAPQVLALLKDVGPDYPGADELRSWAEAELQRQRQIAVARQAYDGEQLLHLLVDAPSDYPNADVLRNWAHTEIERRRQLERAQADYDSAQILALLADVESDYPNVDALRGWAQAEIQRRGRLAAARGAYDTQSVLTLLTEVPEDYPQREELRLWVEQEIARQQQVVAAQRVYDGKVVLALLADVTSAYPRREELRAWANAEIARQAQLEAARAVYDGKRILGLLADAPVDYPGLDEWRRWADAEVRRYQQIEAARAAYDGAALLQLLAEAPAGYPSASELSRWAQAEIQRQKDLTSARQSYDGARVLALLSDISDSYPYLQELRQWAAAEIERRRRLETARNQYDIEQVLELVDEAPPDYPWTAELQRWAQAETVRRQQIEEAHGAYDGQRILDLLADVSLQYPRYLELQQWAEQERQRRVQITAARQAGRWEDAVRLLAATPADYPDRDQRLKEAQQALQHQRHLETLWQQANAAFQAGRWQEAGAICAEASAAGGEATRFGRLAEQAQQEQDTDQAVEQALQASEQAAQSGDLSQALMQMKHALSLRPQRSNLQQRVEGLQRQWEHAQRLAEARQAYAAGQWGEVLAALDRSPLQDADSTALAQKARARLSAQLYARAERAEQAADWAGAIAALHELQRLGLADNALPGRLETLRREQEGAQALAEARQALERHRWTAAMDHAEHARQLFPQRENVLAVYAQAQEALVRWREKRRRMMLFGSLAAAVVVIIAGVAFGLSKVLTNETPTPPPVVLASTATMPPTVRPTPTNAPAAASAALPTARPTVAATPTPSAAPTTANPPVATVTTASSGAAVIASPQLAAISTPAPVPTATTPPTTAPTSTATTPPTAAPTSTATTPPTAAPTSTATRTVASRPTATTAILAPVLISPNDDTSVSGQTTFTWNWSGPALAANQGFEVRLWKEGQPDHYGAAEPVQSTSATFDVKGAYGVQQGGAGKYYWTVAVVQLNPYQRTGIEAAPRAITVQVDGGGGDISAPPTWTPPPP